MYGVPLAKYSKPHRFVSKFCLLGDIYPIYNPVSVETPSWQIMMKNGRLGKLDEIIECSYFHKWRKIDFKQSRGFENGCFPLNNEITNTAYKALLCQHLMIRAFLLCRVTRNHKIQNFNIEHSSWHVARQKFRAARLLNSRSYLAMELAPSLSISRCGISCWLAN
jgi:hypothetical protein